MRRYFIYYDDATIMADTAVKQLLDTINDLRHRVGILERRLNETAGTPHFWREDTMASAVARHWSYTDLWEAPITAETEEWATITLTDWWPRTVREAEEALNRINTDIRNQYMTAWATFQDAIVLDYSAIRNAPNAVTHIQSAPDALIVDFVDWQRQFIPLCISRQWMM